MEQYAWILILQNQLAYLAADNKGSAAAYNERVDMLYCLLASSAVHPCRAYFLEFVLHGSALQLQEFLDQYRLGVSMVGAKWFSSR